MSKNKLNSIAVLCLASVPTLALAGGYEAQATAAAKPTTPHMTTTSAPSGTAGELKGAMRKLWEEHIVYTRNYIISALAALPDTDAVAQRLLRNQDDIGNAIKPYYGDAGGAKLSTLLRDHITIATEVVKAAKGGDKAQLATAQQKWSANGKDIAGFLSGANPNWTRKALEDMLQVHLDLTTGEVVGRLNKDWAADIKAYDDGHAHMLMFADALTAGIVKQFPEKFKK
jgi:phage terminase Nu1 subunit (DNA packaging protein)